MTATRKAGTVTTNLTVVKRKSGASMVNVANGYRRDGGAWVKFWPSIGANILGCNIEAVGASSGATYCYYRLTAAGAEDQQIGTGAGYTLIGTWLLEGAAADYDVMAQTVFNNGATLGGSAANTWLNLGTTREWTYGNPAVGSSGNLSLNISIRKTVGGVVQDTASVLMKSQRL